MSDNINDDFGSELSSIESEDEYSVSAKKKADTESGYTIENALKVPRATTYTTQALFDQIHSGDIDLDPEYQRAVVWTDDKQIGLIDSILRNYYLPPVIFAVKTFPDGTEFRTCIDGKQRLSSIYRFIDGHIPHKDPITGQKYWFKIRDETDSQGRRRPKQLLPSKYRRVFTNKQIVCVEYQDLTPSAERDIFQRVQLGLALTPAEKLSVISTPRSKFIRQLMSTYITPSGLASEHIKWDRTRGSDFRTITTSVYVLDQNFKVGQLSQIQKWLKSAVDPSHSFRTKVDQAFSTLCKLLDKKYSKAFVDYKKPKVAPVELVGIIYLVSTLGDMSLPELCDAIVEMRDHVQEHHGANVSLNDRVGKTAIDFINDMAKRRTSSSRKRKLEDASESSSKKPASLPTVGRARPSLPSTPRLPQT